MVIVAATGLIMTSVVGIILGSFRAQNRSLSNKKISENSSWIIEELKKNVFNSSRDNVFCAEDNLSVQVKNIADGGITTLSCDQGNNKIASDSATKQNVLNNNQVTVINCDDFVVCEKDVADNVFKITFKFGLGAITKGVGSSQNFSTNITLRN